MQPGDQAIDSAGDVRPVVQPVARKAQGDVGLADAPLQEAGAGIRDALLRAARQEMLGRVRLEDQIFALIGRFTAKTAERQTGRTGNRFGYQIARIDGL